MKKLLIGIALALSVATLAWALVRRSDGAQKTYRYVQVTRGNVESAVSATGTLQATKTVAVGTQVSGQIAETLADFNDHVKANQLIARIDPVVLQQEVLAGEANLETSQADVAQAKRELDRQQALFDQKLAATSDYNLAQYHYQTSLSAAKLARVNLDRARRNLAYTEIRAPIDGVVSARNVDVGQTVAASLSAPTLFVIARDLSQMQILAAVDESDIGKVRPGQDVRFTVRAYPDSSFTGKVSQVRLQSAIQENVVSYTVVVEAQNTRGLLLPGMTATAEFIVDRATDALKVPNAALRFTPTEAMRAEVQAERGAATSASGTVHAAGASHEGAAAAGRSGTGAGRSKTSSATAALWYLDAQGKLQTMRVDKGITDGQFTQITGPGVQEGMQIIAAVSGRADVAASTSSSPANSSNPFQSSQSRPGPPRGPGM